MQTPAPLPPATLDAALLAEIRALRSFSPGADLEALAKSADSPLALIEAIARTGVVRKEEIGRFWAAKHGVSFVDPFTTVVADEALAAVPAEIAAKAMMLPLYCLGGALTVAMPHPGDTVMIDRVAKAIKLPLSVAFAFPADVADLLRLHYGTEATVGESLRDAEAFHLLPDGVDLDEGGKRIARLAESAEVARFVEALIYFALRQAASDIHVEPREAGAHVRYRIDGTLREVLTYSLKLHASVITRVKILTRQNIAETRFPTDGRFSMPFGTAKVDFRVSTIPSHCGEKAVIRILGSTDRRSMLTLDRMMISQSILRPLRRLSASPSGILFVTGPTGSGKTTTLYAALAELNQPGVNICTIEDPIEIKLEGLTQSQVEPGINLGFGAMLRSLLRQDPDVILVGEIRDLETARIAAEAALTGHLVLATLHTNTAPEAFVRLKEIGVDAGTVAPAVIGVLGQRLAARICENCKEPYTPTEDVLRRFFDDDPLPPVTLYRGRGCRVCNRTGFKGRVAFHELFVVNRTIRAKLLAGAPLNEIEAAARRVGYRPMRHDGLKKVLLGLTTFEEIVAQTPVEFEG